ncbi:MAG: hypothetical protein NC908_02125 [Candidatus Omnitrophica bacterium]|nr:hypothetical protein [Candidatus Omnitrophota bacterium]
MKLKLSILLAVITLVFGYLEFGFSKEVGSEAPIIADFSTEPEILWLWGEVVTVDIANSKLLVRYLDYETDAENEIEFTVNDETTYENVNSLAEISPKDTVSIDYIIDKADNNLAKNISVERPESVDDIPEGLIQEELPLNEVSKEPLEIP